MMERIVPNSPALVAPVQGTPVRGGVAKLVWEPSEGATGYHVQVAADADFEHRIVDTRLGDVTSLVVRRVLHGGEGTVFWRIAALGPGGRGAFSDVAEFFSSPSPAEPPHAGLTAAAGVETGAEGTERDPAPTHHPDTGHAAFGVLVGAILVSVLAVALAFWAFPGLSGADEALVLQRDSVSTALQVQQQQMAERLDRYSADSSGYTIPIDTAIARMAQQADTAAVLPGFFEVGASGR